MKFFQSISAAVKTPSKYFDERHESVRRGKGTQTVCYNYMTAAGVDVANVHHTFVWYFLLYSCALFCFLSSK